MQKFKFPASPSILPKPMRTTPKKKMNDTEKRYGKYLKGLMLINEIEYYLFESIKLRLADNTTYTPDYFIVYKDRLAFHEVKGFWRDDARVKYKVARAMFPWFEWKVVKWEKEWKTTDN